MPTTIQSGIEWTEFHEGYAEHWSGESVTMTRVADVGWDDGTDFVRDMIGTHKKVGTEIFRTLPEPHPFYPWLYCVSCNSHAALGVPDQEAADKAPRYDLIRYVLEYAALPYTLLDDEAAHADPEGELS